MKRLLAVLCALMLMAALAPAASAAQAPKSARALEWAQAAYAANKEAAVAVVEMDVAAAKAEALHGDLTSAVASGADTEAIAKILIDLEQHTADILAAIASLSGIVKDENVDLRAMLRSPLDGQVFEWVEVAYDANGEAVVTLREVEVTAEEAAALLKELDKALKNVPDMTELDLFDLEQKYADYKAAIATLRAIIQTVDENLTATVDNLNA